MGEKTSNWINLLGGISRKDTGGEEVSVRRQFQELVGAGGPGMFRETWLENILFFVEKTENGGVEGKKERTSGSKPYESNTGKRRERLKASFGKARQEADRPQLRTRMPRGEGDQ